jgi:phenylacetate-CoA ligase
MFVHPGQIAEVTKRFPELGRTRLLVRGEAGADEMLLQVEVANPPEGLADRLGQSVRDVTKLRAQIDLVAPGSLPNDGKVIEDQRSYK